MDIFSRGKFEACLESVDEQLKKQHISVSMELMLHSDALVCQYMLVSLTLLNLKWNGMDKILNIPLARICSSPWADTLTGKNWFPQREQTLFYKSAILNPVE